MNKIYIFKMMRESLITVIYEHRNHILLKYSVFFFRLLQGKVSLLNFWKKL